MKLALLALSQLIIAGFAKLEIEIYDQKTCKTGKYYLCNTSCCKWW